MLVSLSLTHSLTAMAAAENASLFGLRAMFYSLTPEETYVQSMKDLPDVLMWVSVCVCCQSSETSYSLTPPIFQGHWDN